MENPLASIMSSSSNDNQSKRSSDSDKHNVILKIDVKSPQIRNLDLNARFEQPIIPPFCNVESSRDQLRSEESKQGDLDQIRDKLCQSSLNKVFNDDNASGSDLNSHRITGYNNL